MLNYQRLIPTALVLAFFFAPASAAGPNHKAMEFTEIGVLINEMTTTPERQQKALDRLANYDSRALLFLLPYFSDRRTIASKDVRFLNDGPRAFEKYFTTGASTVNEVVIQYYCWRTRRCDLDTAANDAEKVRRQVEMQMQKSFR